jgi:hypothetical protein
MLYFSKIIRSLPYLSILLTRISIIQARHCSQYLQKPYETLFSQRELRMEIKLLEKISVDTDVANQAVIRYSALVRYCKKYGSVMGQYLTYS